MKRAVPATKSIWNQLFTCGAADAGKQSQAISDVSGRDGVHVPDSGPQMWMPMEASALSKWRWVDWLRFFFYRRAPMNRFCKATPFMCAVSATVLQHVKVVSPLFVLDRLCWHDHKHDETWSIVNGVRQLTQHLAANGAPHGMCHISIGSTCAKPLLPAPMSWELDLVILCAGRHYTDLVLVAVVALCTLENDVIHAGYLALALLFFRRRDALRTERNRCVLVCICTRLMMPDVLSCNKSVQHISVCCVCDVDVLQFCNLAGLLKASALQRLL